MSNYPSMTTEQKINRLSVVLAAQASFETEAEFLKDDLKVEIPEGEAKESGILRAFHILAIRKNPAWKTIAERFNPSRQLIAANTKKTPVHSIKITTKQGNV